MHKENPLPQRVQMEEEQAEHWIAIQPTNTPSEQPTIDNMTPIVSQDMEDEDEVEEDPAARTR